PMISNSWWIASLETPSYSPSSANSFSRAWVSCSANGGARASEETINPAMVGRPKSALSPNSSSPKSPKSSKSESPSSSNSPKSSKSSKSSPSSKSPKSSKSENSRSEEHTSELQSRFDLV